MINDEALAYMRDHALAAPVIARLAGHVKRQFADPIAWQRHLKRLRIATQQVAPDQVCIATEGALWGSVKAHGFLPETVIISDDAGQFDVGRHALCWVHAERLVHKLDTFTDLHRTAQSLVRELIWWFYGDLKAYRADPTARGRAALRARFDRIFKRRTGFATLDRLLELHANIPELLMVLDRPEIPLHTNGSENDIRCQVTKRKVSGGTRSSDVGRDRRVPSSVSPKPAPSSASVFGLSRRQARRPRLPGHPAPAAARQRSLPIAVIARTVLPLLHRVGLSRCNDGLGQEAMRLDAA